MLYKRPAEERGHADHGWLKSNFSFSFADYHDENFMGFGPLRVINDDVVAAGKGFGMHPHRDMEIITYVLSGELEHKDSMGTGEVIRPGDVQHMSAGTGVLHSEFNPSDKNPVHLLQIWIIPNQRSVTPRYAQKHFAREEKLNKLRLVASGDGADGSIDIYQDAKVFASVLEKDQAVSYELPKDRHAWLQVATGSVKLNDLELKAGDGVAVAEEDLLTITGTGDGGEIILFDV
jgi:quercetin 2,3-dioxygenase